MNSLQRRNIIDNHSPVRAAGDKSIAQELDLPDERCMPLEESNAVAIGGEVLELRRKRMK